MYFTSERSSHKDPQVGDIVRSNKDARIVVGVAVGQVQFHSTKFNRFFTETVEEWGAWFEREKCTATIYQQTTRKV